MTDKKRKEPKLRFPGFEGEWEERKLGDLGSVEMCRRIFKHETSEFGEIPFYKISTFGGTPDSYISSELFNEYKSKFSYPNIGDVLISASGSIGKTVVYNGEDAYFQDSNIVWLNHYGNLSNKFLKYFYEINKWDGIEGTTIKRLYNSTILNTKISIPTFKEQEKIGEFLVEIDNIITQHQCKLDNLNILKKSLLQKMFPKKGKKIPELRFPGFSGEWEERKLGEIGSTYTGLTGKTKEDFGHGDAKFITYMNVFSNSIIDLNMTESVEIDNKQNQVQAGDVFFTTSSETPEEVGMTSVIVDTIPNLYLNSFCFGYRPFTTFNHNYLANFLRSDIFRKEIILQAQGISRYNISKNKVMEINILYPEIAEQTKIGSIFNNIDKLITLHQRKLNNLNKLKKGLLQQMFV